jgi:acyl-CoA thioester hydrolase
MDLTAAAFSLEFSVRDYECDLQGIVNNAVYQNYLEHTRHMYLKAVGLDFAELHNRGIDLVVAKMVLEYKVSLKSGDCFIVTLIPEKKGKLQIVLNQGIYRLPDKKPILYARVLVAMLKDGRPARPDFVLSAIEAHSGAIKHTAE